MLSRATSRASARVVVARRFASDATGDAKVTLRDKIRTLPPEVAMKIVREGLRQKKENPSSFADWLAGSGLFEKYRQWQGYRRYGLKQDDLIADVEHIHEAIVRLPKKVQEARSNRIKQAFVLSAGQKQLDDEKWLKESEDIPDLYPYAVEVEREFADREAFRGKGYVF